jgi:adenosylmethionine-8-amino-7-oxononanoate aminotransferase
MPAAPGSRLIRNVLGQHLPTIERAEGVFVWDDQGKRYLDGSAGAVVAGLGHADPVVLAAMAEQARKVAFTHRGAFTSRPAELLAERLAELTGMAGVWLVGSGSEAVEASLQFALQYWREVGEPGRARFLSHRHGYHGSTLGALSLSGHARRDNVEALAHDFPVLPAPWPYRYGAGRDTARFTADLLAGAERAVATAGPHLAGVVVEAVGGATGSAVVPPDGYLPGLERICREAGVLLIVDEVLTGLGRTGTALAVDHWGVRPDIVALGKGLGAGYTPIAATLVNERVLGAIAAGSGTIRHGHTYAGNPLSAAIALAVLRRTDELGLYAAARRAGERVGAGLAELAARHPVVGEARGIGLLWALELVTDHATRRSDAPPGELSNRVVTAAAAHGLLVYPSTGGINDAVTLAPPLTIADAEIDLALTALDAALTDVESERITVANPARPAAR